MCSLVTLAACDGGGDGAPWTLRPTVTEVVSERAGTVTSTTISDADRDGNRIAILRPSTSAESFLNYPWISISDDLGKTWRHVWVPKEIRLDLGGDSYQIGIHLQEGRVFLFLSADAGNSFSVWRVWEINLDTGEPTEAPIPLTRSGFFMEHHADGPLRYVTAEGAPFFVTEIDPTKGEVSYEEFGCSGRACDVPMFYSRDGGNTWDGYNVSAPGKDSCSAHLDVTAKTTTQACIHRPLWPVGVYTEIPRVAYRGDTPYMLWSTPPDQDSPQSYATALIPGTSPTVSETLQLGPGRVRTYNSVGTFPRRRFGDFTFLEYAQGPGDLVTLTEAGAERAAIPITPCTQDDGCGYVGGPDAGYGQVQWIVPIDNGEHLIFYSTVIDATGTGAIYVAREKATLVPVTGSEPPPVTTVDLPAGAQPMNELERACALYANCHPYPTIGYKMCLERWITESPNRPGVTAARARFLAAATRCASLDALESSACPAECTEAGGTCAGGTGTCSNEIIPVALGTCGQCDANGNYIYCAGTRGFAVACGAGTVCSQYAGCVLSDLDGCDAYAPSPSCVSGGVQTCSSSRLVTLAHCDLEGAACDAGTATCVPSSSEGACTPSTFQSQCASATHVLQCSYGQIKYIACSDLDPSYTECLPVAEGVMCH